MEIGEDHTANCLAFLHSSQVTVLERQRVQNGVRIPSWASLTAMCSERQAPLQPVQLSLGGGWPDFGSSGPRRAEQDTPLAAYRGRAGYLT